MHWALITGTNAMQMVEMNRAWKVRWTGNYQQRLEEGWSRLSTVATELKLV